MLRLFPAQPLAAGRPRMVLDGEWEFRDDPRKEGVPGHWEDPRVPFASRIRVPGCRQAQGLGSPGKELRCSSTDDAWYRTRFSVPRAWCPGRVTLRIGGVHPAGAFWLNGQFLGASSSSRTPLAADVHDLLQRDSENILTLRVYRPALRLDGVWDSTERLWSGPYREIAIEHSAAYRIDRIDLCPQAPDRKIRVRTVVSGPGDGSQRPALTLEGRMECCRDGAIAGTAAAPVGGELVFSRDALAPWSPDHPARYRVRVILTDGQRVLDEAAIRCGVRSIRVERGRILLNGRPVFLRGGCDDQVYPETICPPASKAFYRKRLQTLKAYGFNYIKSCVEVFTQEFLDAADEVGVLVCEEMPFGLYGDHRAARNDPSAERKDLFRRELAHIVQADRHHPSVVLYSMASELGLNKCTANGFRFFAQELPGLTRRMNPSALVIDATGGLGDRIDTPLGTRDTDIFEAGGMLGREPFRKIPACFEGQPERPWILHEYQWWSALPDPRLKPRYAGLPTLPTGPMELEATAERAGLTHLLPAMVENSRKLKVALRREGLEFARRLHHCAGYHHWLMHDISWCPEGVVNEFWEPPDDLTPTEFRRVNADTVIMLDDGGTRCYPAQAEFSLPLLVSHFGSAPLRDVRLAWDVRYGDRLLLAGCARLDTLACGQIVTAGRVRGRIDPAGRACMLTVNARLTDRAGQEINRNAWNLWVFPDRVPHNATHSEVYATGALARIGWPGLRVYDGSGPLPGTAGAIMTDAFTQAVGDYLEAGGRVLLFSRKALPEDRGKHSDLFRSVPYNEGDSGNMGTIVRNHPALGGFPHEGWCDLQFFHLIHGAHPLDLEAYRPVRIDPIVRCIGHQRTLRDKAYLFEARVGKGRLLASGFQVPETLATRVESRRMLACLFAYATGAAFRPETVLKAGVLARAMIPNP